MSDTLAAQRRFFAEEIQLTSNLKTPGVIEALATVPRERFLPPGPWTIRGEADFQAAPRQTPDAEKRERADFVVDTSHGLDPVRAQIKDILAEVVKMPQRRT